MEEVKERASGNPDIHILLIPPEGDIEINALQRAATVILQKSIKEGFGLTVTEALWKGKIVYSGSRLSKYGDVVAEKTGLGRTWIGVVLMASVTSSRTCNRDKLCHIIQGSLILQQGMCSAVVYLICLSLQFLMLFISRCRYQQRRIMGMCFLQASEYFS